MIDLDTFIYSDLHLGQKGIEKWESNRLKHIKNDESLDDMCIRHINDVVKDNNALCLGDFAFKRVAEFTTLLNVSNTVLILGNHDDKAESIKFNNFKDVVNGVWNYKGYNGGPIIWKLSNQDLTLVSALIYEIKSLNLKIMFSHYPLFYRDIEEMRNEESSKLIISRQKYLEKIYELEECNINIHGHTHSKDTGNNHTRRINACLDYYDDFKPKTLRELLSLNDIL